jgi:hypothetical protein
MDEFGCLKICEEDAKRVMAALEGSGTVIFPLNTSDGTAMIFTLSARFAKLGTMPWGGNPTGRCLISVQKLGAYHFSANHIEPGYFEEKLNLHREDAEGFSRFWDLLWAADRATSNDPWLHSVVAK